MGALSKYVIHGRPSIRVEVIKETQPYWSFRDEVAVIDRKAVTGRITKIPAFSQKRALYQLHVKHMGAREKKANGS